MRLALSAALTLALLAPAAAAAKARDPGTCIRIAQQLVHYDSMKAKAYEDGNDVWGDRFKAQIERTEEHFAAQCPKQAAEQRSIQQMAELLKMAGRAALTFFTMGAY